MQYRGAEAEPGDVRRDARASGGGAPTRATHEPQKSLLKTLLPSGKARNMLPSNHPRGRGVRGRGGGECVPEVDPAVNAALLSTPRSPRSAHSRSPTSRQIALGKMSGFGPGDGGWGERVEGRRQQRLLQRNREGASMVAEVDESGKIQTVAPSAPAAPVAGHHQAVSPPRLRRLVRAEVRKSRINLLSCV